MDVLFAATDATAGGKNSGGGDTLSQSIMSGSLMSQPGGNVDTTPPPPPHDVHGIHISNYHLIAQLNLSIFIRRTHRRARFASNGVGGVGAAPQGVDEPRDGRAPALATDRQDRVLQAHR